jgi:hypothetical protein
LGVRLTTSPHKNIFFEKLLKLEADRKTCWLRSLFSNSSIEVSYKGKVTPLQAQCGPEGG